MLEISAARVVRSENRGLRRLHSLASQGKCTSRPPATITKASAARASVLERVAVSDFTRPPASRQKKTRTKRTASIVLGSPSGKKDGDGSAKDRAGVKGESASSVPSTPATVATGGDWIKNVFTGLEILLLLAAAAWVCRAVWRVL